MRLKSFYAHDVLTALNLARDELGPDAVLVDSRKAPPDSRHLGEIEVVAAAGAPETPPLQAADATPPQVSELASQVAELRRQMERMAAAVTRSSLFTAAHTLPNAELMSAFGTLIETDLDAEIAHAILGRVRSEGMPPTRDHLRLAIAAELAGRFEVDARLGTGAAGPRIAAVVGPCGSGKTSIVAKLAARYGLITRRPTQILSLDNWRVAAGEQLRTYAAILGVAFQAVESPHALVQALAEVRNKDLILIDTPGFGGNDREVAAELAEFTEIRDIDVHLVLTASMRSADLSRAVDRFEIFRPRKLIFTKLDETDAFGPIVNEASRTGKAVSFLSSGQRIPEDLEPASKARIIDLVFRAR